jgi:hypothetical protein
MSRPEDIEKLARDRVAQSGGQLSMETAREVATAQLDADDAGEKAEKKAEKKGKPAEKPQ